MTLNQNEQKMAWIVGAVVLLAGLYYGYGQWSGMRKSIIDKRTKLLDQAKDDDLAIKRGAKDKADFDADKIQTLNPDRLDYAPNQRLIETTFGNGGPAGSSWSSPADEGFRRAAETVGAPVAGQTTSAGLPQRVPSANLVPGSVSARPAPRAGQAPPPGGGPSRSPEAVRARLMGFQVHGREGRAPAQGPGSQGPGTDEN